MPMPLHLRSLALLLFIFGASAALAAYVEMKYEDVTPQHAVQFREPTPKPAIQSTKPVAPLSHSDSTGRSSSNPTTFIAPATESTQAQRLGPSAFELKPPTDAWRAAGSNAGLETSGSNAGQALKCNTQACSNTYRSFDAADCTYQPANGPRRACRK